MSKQMNVTRFGATFLTFQNGWNYINGKLMKQLWKLWKYEDKMSKIYIFEEQNYVPDFSKLMKNEKWWNIWKDEDKLSNKYIYIYLKSKITFLTFQNGWNDINW